mmetsp:Transcript_16471/g.47023  ORF Transcript_16471/g.47023 Transcript_16471/m.47023 type:complete len:313 (-) Transcript_16471:124-1062(-)
MPNARRGVLHAAVSGHLHGLDAPGLKTAECSAAALLMAEGLVGGLRSPLDLLHLRVHLSLQLCEGDLLRAPVHDDLGQKLGTGQCHGLPTGDLRDGAHEVAGKAILAKYWLDADAVAGDAVGGHLPSNVQWVPSLGIPIGEAISRGLQAVGRRIGDQHRDFGCIWAPRQVQSVKESCGHSFRTVAAPRSAHGVNVRAHLLRAAREGERLGDVGAVLGRVVTVADKGEAHVGPLALGNAADDVMDVPLRGLDVRAHGPGAVAHEAQVQLRSWLRGGRHRRLRVLGSRAASGPRQALLADDNPVVRDCRLAIRG